MGAGTSSRLLSLLERPILHIASLDWDNRGPGLLLCHSRARVSDCHWETYLSCSDPGMRKGTQLAEASGLLNHQGSHFELFDLELTFPVQ